MAGTVNLQFKFSSSSGTAITGSTVQLLNQIYSNPFTAISTSIAYSGSTDATGMVLLSGIGAGTYDVRINGTGSSAVIRNYVVKNEFPVAIGESSLCFGNSNFIGSNQAVSGILTQNKTTNARTIKADLNSVTGTRFGAYTGTVSFPVYPFSGTEAFNTTTIYSKQSGNSYSHNTDAIPFTQRARFTVSL